MTAPRKVRLVDPAPASPPVPPLRTLEHSTVYAHSPEMRQRWADAVSWLRARPDGSAWILDRRMERKS